MLTGSLTGKLRRRRFESTAPCHAGIQPRRDRYAVVKPLRAIADLLREGKESRDRLRQALSDGMRLGIITRTELARHPDRKVFEGLLEGKA